jgi:hypothetical protein
MSESSSTNREPTRTDRSQGSTAGSTEDTRLAELVDVLTGCGSTGAHRAVADEPVSLEPLERVARAMVLVRRS